MRLLYKDFLIVIYYVAFWMRYFTNIDIRYSFIVFLIFCLFTFAEFEIVKKGRLQSLYNKNLLIVVIACIGIAINNNHTLADGVMLWSWISVGILLAYAEDRLDFINKINMVTFIYLALKSILSFTASTSDLEVYISDRVGSNTISIIALQCFFIDYIWRKKNNKKFSYFMPILLLLVSVMSRSLMSILATALLLVEVYLQEDVKQTKKLLRRGMAVLVIMIAILFGRGAIDEVVSYFSQGDSNTRFYLWTHYYMLTKESIVDVIFGLNNRTFIKVYALAYYRNLHNTFFNWHYYFGLIPTLYFIFVIFQNIRNEFKSKDYIMIVIVLISMLRGITDEATYSFMMIWMYLYSKSAKERYMERFSDGAGS